jgi:hypothetical protein
MKVRWVLSDEHERSLFSKSPNVSLIFQSCQKVRALRLNAGSYLVKTDLNEVSFAGIFKEHGYSLKLQFLPIKRNLYSAKNN